MTDRSILDDPIEAAKEPLTFLKAALQWHFDPATGSPFWLERASSFDFHPVHDIESYDDLIRFPDVVAELRDVRIDELIPKGYGPRPDVVRIAESGGTTGAPKRVPLLRDWWELLITWCVDRLDELEFPRDCVALLLVPSGPHAGGDQWLTVHNRRGCTSLTIDIDPRWVKKLIERGDSAEVSAYIAHLVDQAEHHLRSQKVTLLTGTPPMIAQLCERDETLSHMQDVKAIGWGGAHMDADSRDYYRTTLFPGAVIAGGYGTTIAGGGGAQERAGLGPSDPCTFDAMSPYVTFSVVDPTTKTPVPIGERGQLLVNHVSRSFFMPNNLERDTAVRAGGPANQVGDSLIEIAPLATFEGTTAIEGVY